MLMSTGCLAPLKPLWLFQAVSTLILFQILFCNHHVCKARVQIKTVVVVVVKINLFSDVKLFRHYYWLISTFALSIYELNNTHWENVFGHIRTYIYISREMRFWSSNNNSNNKFIFKLSIAYMSSLGINLTSASSFFIVCWLSS